jgi:hypothetical protein
LFFAALQQLHYFNFNCHKVANLNCREATYEISFDQVGVAAFVGGALW